MGPVDRLNLPTDKLGGDTMRIPLDRKCLLGFQNSRTDFDFPVTAAKVGHKPTIGIGVASASHRELAETVSASIGVALTFSGKNL